MWGSYCSSSNMLDRSIHINDSDSHWTDSRHNTHRQSRISDRRNLRLQHSRREERIGMKFSRRRAVSPIIASLLLIAIAVAAGIIVYVYVNSLAGNLTSSGGNQVSQQIQLQAYSFNTAGSGTGQFIDLNIENVGSSAVSISQVYVDGTALTEWGTGTTGTYGKYFDIPNLGPELLPVATCSSPQPPTPS